jgi:hypothetical protein
LTKGGAKIPFFAESPRGRHASGDKETTGEERYPMRAMGFGALGFVVLAFAAGGVACSSGGSGSGNQGSSSGGSSGGYGGPTCNPCADGGGSTLQSSGHDVNPYGAPYPSPSSGYGHVPRSGNTPGSILPNFKFYGFENGVVPSPDTMSIVSLADYYDPCLKTYKMIHLTAAAVWCGPCNQETDAIVAAKSDLASKGVVVLQILFDGAAMGTPVYKTTLESWIRLHNSNFTEMLDSELVDPNLGGFFNTAYIPWNADVDPRTMELLTSTDGFSAVDTDLAPGLADVAKPPAYTVSYKCQ